MTQNQGLRALTADELDLIAGGVAPSRTGGCIPPKGPKGPKWPVPPTGPIGPIDPITGTGPYMPY